MKSNRIHWKRYLCAWAAVGILVAGTPAASFGAPETGAAAQQETAEGGSRETSAEELSTKAIYGTSPEQAQSARAASIAAAAAQTAGTGADASAKIDAVVQAEAGNAAQETPVQDPQAWPTDTGIFSEAGVVVDFDSRCVLFGQNMHEQKAPASITKILTALVVLEHVPEEDLDRMITYSHDAVYNTESGSGNKFGLEEGDSLSIRDALYLLLLASSNQSANALAEYVGGSREGFVQMMNDKVAALGCVDSHFANPSGLNDETQRTTCYDMALIAMEAYRNERLLEIGSTLTHKITTPMKNHPNGCTVKMEHKLLITEEPNDENYYPFAVAGKTGYTSVAGQTLVTYAERDGRRLVAVTMKSRQKTHYTDTINLLEFGFNRFRNVPVSEAETEITKASGNVVLGDTTYDAGDLTLEEGVITRPKTMEVSDLERTVLTGSEMPKNAPDGAAAFIQYSYRDRVTGGAFVTAESLKAKETTAAETKAKKADTEEKKGMSFSWPFSGIGTAVLAAVLGIIVLTVMAFFTYSAGKRRDQERLERRRARLREMGISEDEFAEMVGRRWKHPKEKDENPDGEEFLDEDYGENGELIPKQDEEKEEK